MFSRSSRTLAIFCSVLLASTPIQTALAQATDDPGRPAAALEATAEALDALSAATPREPFDVRALAASLAALTPAELNAWVGTNTRLLAYRGTLKGAAGTLEDRAGNSLDRALLLAALLTEKGVSTRLARAELPADKTAELALLAATPRTPPAVGDQSADMAIVEKLASDPRIDGARYRAFVQSETARMAVLKAKGEAMTAQIAAALTPLVAGAGPAPDGAIADHWWVQAEIDGVWTDLDPAGAGAPAPAETMAIADIPADMKHSVTVRIVAEVARDGTLAATPLVEIRLASGDIQGRLAAVAHRAVGLTPVEDMDGTDQAVFDSAAAAKLWVPAIVLDETSRGNLVTASGEIAEATEANIAKYGETSTFNTAADAISAMGEPEPEEGAPGGVFTAEWIEFEIAAPGVAPVIERRMIFDAIGAATRAAGRFDGDISDAAKIDRGLALQDDIDFTILTGVMASGRATQRTALLAAMGLRAAAAFIVSAPDAEGPAPPDGYRRPAAELSEFATARFGFAAGSADIVSPNIVLLRSGLRAKDGALSDLRVFDIVANPAAGAPAAVLTAGVADTVSEHLLLGAPETSANTAARYAADLAAGRAWATLTPGNDAALDGLAGDAGVKALLAADLQRGFTVVASAGLTMTSATWWRIDPTTGRTLGMTAAGGAETVEYLGTLEIAMLIGFGACTLKGVNAKKAAGGNWFRMPKAKRASVMACYGGVVIGVFFQSAAALGLIVGAVGTFADEF